MATFEPTQEEKDAETYLQWDDAELGKLTKYIALVLRENRKDAEGLHRVASASCAMMLISACLDSNAEELTIDTTGHTTSGVATGDWVLTVKRKTAA